MKIKMFDEFLNEDHKGKEKKGLMVFGKTPEDNDKIRDFVDKSDYYAEWDEQERYWFFPEEEANYDELEVALAHEFKAAEIQVRFEGV